MKKILFTGGGSAGHVVPNVALIEELLSDGKVDVCYMGTGGIEKSILSEWKIPYYEIACPKLVREWSWSAFTRNLRIPTAFFRAMKQAKNGLLAFRPDAVFSKGGYVALPVIYAAKRLKIPCFAHESDYSLGLANRLSACACERIFTSFPETAKTTRRGTYSGAPIKRALFFTTRAEARKRLGIPFNAQVVLVFGGGSGSVAINNALYKHLKTLTDRYVILHVCGKGNRIETNMKNYYQFEFVSDMSVMYACADLVISRAGSGTVFEILALKKLAILVPLQGQTRGDQAENAAYFAKRGLVKVLQQNELTTLPETIENALADTDMKERLQNSAFRLGNETILRTLYSAIEK